MFNVGLFARTKKSAVLQLTSRTMPRNIYDEYGGWSEVSFSLAANGQASGTGAGNYPNQWLTPITAGVGAGYEVKFARLNPALTNVQLVPGTFGSWLSLSSSRALYTNIPCDLYGGPQETIYVEIRAVGSTTVLASANITFR